MIMAYPEVHGRSYRKVSEKCGIMEMRFVLVLLLAVMAINLQQADSVNVLVVRENADSKSEEDTSEMLSAEESEEIDFLLDLIQNEARDRNPPPVTTVRVIQRKPDVELVAQHSERKENVQSKPHSFKEYHVHYHNHQHKGPSKPTMVFDEDSLNPLIWSSQIPLGDFDFYKQLQESSPEPYSEQGKVKSFKDFETFLKSNLKSPSEEKLDQEAQMEAFKDFNSFIKPKIPTYKTKEESPFERFRKFHEYFDSEDEKVSYPQQDRFAGFKDFSEIESADNPKPEEKPNVESPQKKTVQIKDYAIVIKSRPRVPQNKDNFNKQIKNDKGASPGPKIPPFVNKLRIPNNELHDLPKVLEAAGGAPKYIDELNKLRYPQPDILDFPLRSQFPLNLNILENEQANLLNLRPYPSHPFQRQHLPRYPMRANLNGWLLKRLLRKR